MKPRWDAVTLLAFVVGLCAFPRPAVAYYDPSVARWINRDPVGEDGGMNVSRFVENDPIQKTDPLGLRCCVTFRNPCILGPTAPAATFVGLSASLSGFLYYCGAWRFTCTYLCRIATATGDTCPAWAVPGAPMSQTQSFLVWVSGMVVAPGPIPPPTFACPATSRQGQYCF